MLFIVGVSFILLSVVSFLFEIILSWLFVFVFPVSIVLLFCCVYFVVVYLGNLSFPPFCIKYFLSLPYRILLAWESLVFANRDITLSVYNVGVIYRISRTFSRGVGL